MIDFSEVSIKIKDFFEEKKMAAIVITVLVTLFFIALIIFVCQPFTQKKMNLIQEEMPLVQDQKLILPENASTQTQYALSREPQEKWTKEQAQKYFTLPTQEELKNLENANDDLVDQILGSVP